MANNTVNIEMAVTVAMTDQQLQQWARDNGVAIENVPADVRSYILHNLLATSRAREDYWSEVTIADS